VAGSRQVAVATSSALAAEAAAATADNGGNAVDCAIAAAMLTMNTEPGVCALAGGAYVTVWPADGAPVTIDGGVAVPGHDLGSTYAPDEGVALHMEYGGGVDTLVGCASVGVPGALAACEHAALRYGAIPWSATLSPAIRAARDGFPLPGACHFYLTYSGEPVFCRSEDGRRALFDDGELRSAGATIVIPHLADSLESIAADGARAFYRGDLAAAIVEHVRAGGGRLTYADLARFEAIERPALRTSLNDWSIALNPPPAIGGGVLAGLLILTRNALAGERHDAQRVTDALVAAQTAALGFRRAHLDASEDVSGDVERMLAQASSGQLGAGQSGATVHTSSVDADGLACAITASSGYGSGEMPANTGLWLNNCLGELELNQRGLAAGPVGARLPSNMTPGVARSPDSVLAFGSPGANRITTALQQFLIRHLLLAEDLQSANTAPRVHVEANRQPVSLSVEDGVALHDTSLPVKDYPAQSMYFGGVAAAKATQAGPLEASADPRRAGGVFVSG